MKKLLAASVLAMCLVACSSNKQYYDTYYQNTNSLNSGGLYARGVDVGERVDSTINVVGHVVDNKQGQIISGVLVSVLPTYPVIEAWTNAAGCFIMSIPPGKYVFGVFGLDKPIQTDTLRAPSSDSLLVITFNISKIGKTVD
jgi:hypothetical protein